MTIAGTTDQGTRLTGLAFSVAKRRARMINASPLCARFGYTAVAARRRATIWGGGCLPSPKGGKAQGAEYDSRTDRWSLLPKSPLGQRSGHVAVWTGNQMIVWGGVDPSGESTRGLSSGAAYDRASRSWKTIAPSSLEPRFDAEAVWTGSEMLVWGGRAVAASGDGRYLSDGAAYSPVEDKWRSISTAPIPSGGPTNGSGGAAVWTGDALVGWNGEQLAFYEPESDQWRVAASPPLQPRDGASLVWTGSEAIVWGGIKRGCGTCFLDDGAAYDPATDTWRDLPAGPLAPRDRHVAAWTGEAMLVFGGCCRGNRYFADAAVYSP